MKTNKSILILLIILIFVFFSQSFFSLPRKRNSKNPKRKIEKILNKNVFKDAFVGIKILNLNKKKLVFELNSEKLFTPASTLKLLTTSAALFFLPSNYSFETDFLSNGVVVDSVLRGDFIIRGGGDPLFSYSDLDSLLTGFVNSGVKEIEGNIIADISWGDSLYFGKGWMCDDNPEPFLPYISPILLEEAKVRIIVKPSTPFTLSEIEIFPPVSSIKIINNILTVPEDSTYFTITRNWKNNDNTIFSDGFIYEASEPDTTFLNLYAPEKIFLDAVFEILKEKKGIKIKGKKLFGKNLPYVKKLFSFRHRIDTVLTKTNKESDNLCAEMILRALGKEYFGKPATAEKGIILIDSLIKLSGNNPKNYKIVDGSGISRYNLISPALFVDIFTFLHNKKPAIFSSLIKTLPVMGIDGTLKDRHKKGKAYGIVRAKTGTMKSVSALTGITVNASGDTLVFSMLMQNFSGSIAVVRLYQDIITEIITNSR